MRVAKRKRIYSRKFDWDRARDMREAGHTWAHIARTLGVSPAAIARVCEESVNRRMRKTSDAIQRAGGVCVDCGKPCSFNYSDHRKGRHQRCKPCGHRHRATTVREHELECRRCKQWLPDESFWKDSRQPSRRYRHRECKTCGVNERLKRHRKNGRLPIREQREAKRLNRLSEAA